MSIKRTTTITFLLLIVLSLSAQFTYSAVNSRLLNSLKIAYINGFVEASGLEVRQLRAMQLDEFLLHEVVQQSAENYIARVEKLNEEPADE